MQAAHVRPVRPRSADNSAPPVKSQEIHLWPEPAAAGGAAAPRWAPLRMPAGVRHLAARPAGVLILAASAEAPEEGVMVETYRNARQQLRLLARFPRATEPMVNGEPAPRRVVLKPGDAVQWFTGLVVHVTVFQHPQLGAPPAAQLGKPCPICRVPFAPGTTCYTCACGVVFHCEAGVGGGLQCAQWSKECPRCKRPVVLEEAYDYQPSPD